MKKKSFVLFLTATMAASVFAGCGSTSDFARDSKTEISEKEKENNDVSASEEQTNADESTSEEKPETDQVEKTVTADTALSGEKWVDLDNMQFTVNGHVYTLGKSTLQDMINDGCPFNENDIANAGNNLNSNSQSQGFRINLGEYWSAQVYTGNYTDSNAVIKDCPITQVYLPCHSDKKQDILSFAFPTNMTMEELRASAGEPTDIRNYDDGDYHQVTYKYEKDSETYISKYGYKFEFTNDELKYVTIEYLP